VLLSPGDAVTGAAEFMVEQLMTLDERIQVLVVCGNNPDP
jgi:hypothetical protein